MAAASNPGISPEPTDEEAAAIVAAIAASGLGPWPSGQVDEETAPDSTGWRFSGRWWRSARSWNR